MQMVIPGQSNTVTHDLVSKITGSEVASGVVTFYLRALNGVNTGKWWRASDGTWQSVKSSAGAGTYASDAQWQCAIVAAAWNYGVIYSLCARESGSLDIPYSEQIGRAHV